MLGELVLAHCIFDCSPSRASPATRGSSSTMWRLAISTATLAVAVASATDAAFSPMKVAIASEPVIPTDSFQDGFSLTTELPLATLDYGYEVAGLPFFKVKELSSGPVEIEVKYSEPFTALTRDTSDGPFSVSTSLSNTHRVETYRLTTAGEMVAAAMNQAGQRWQTIRLLMGDGVTFESVGFTPTVDVYDDFADLPGTFVSSNDKYNKIWDLGPRSLTAACLNANSQVSSWKVTAENGTYVPGVRSGISYKTWNLTSYELEFETKIERAGFGLTIGYDLSGNRNGIQIHLASEYPDDTTFTNVNRTLFPPNTVKLAFGFDFVNQTSATSYVLGEYPVPFAVKEDVWYTVNVVVDSDAENIVFSLDGSLVMNATISEFGFTAEQLTFYGYTTTGAGAIGFGGWHDQAAFVRNVVVRDIDNAVVYSNTMTGDDVLGEYGMLPNTRSVCLDGAKRDRLIWLGDFFHTTRVVAVSSAKSEQLTGTWEYAFEYQSAEGQYPGFIPISYTSPIPDSSVFLFNAGTNNTFLAFPDYDILGLLGFVSYMEYFDDRDFAIANWESFKRAMAWVTSHQTSNGLIDLLDQHIVFLGAGAGIAVNAASVQLYNGMARVAASIGDSESAEAWATFGSELKDTVNTLLWNETMGVYSLSASEPDAFGVNGIAFAITSGVANETQALSSIAKLAELKHGPGYKDDSTADANDYISPNTNGFLLSALFETKQTEEIAFLLDNLWDAMISNESLATGAGWEYVNLDLMPGLDEYSSQSHPWSTAPTYALTNYLAGIRPVDFGFKTWIIEPLISGLNVTSVAAKVSTPYGSLGVSWELDGQTLNVQVDSPQDTEGVFVVPQVGSADPYIKIIQGGGSTKFTVFVEA